MLKKISMLLVALTLVVGVVISASGNTGGSATEGTKVASDVPPDPWTFYKTT